MRKMMVGTVAIAVLLLCGCGKGMSYDELDATQANARNAVYRVAELESKVEDLESRIDDLEARLDDANISN